ncbi:hypothetical protein CIB95_09330 [Lottiidibacillus patelloidae]|uniref:Activator of Hsp90 ATPase homologue 1/2-like C-terminal domain-containing protein n=1 Tax=Lottiidibacillus patelloidae TaxID=2670334 RepID=A0A263BTS8_9BACI|nr:SRPBCC domain-containing protein [Lottiidibacillus patelloidae]OZM56962.1 hypothetical protein CIB95_09330 [Lottiidibacillus patelloidae]
MESFQKTQVINAAPREVYKAFTTEEGLRGWWTPDCDVGEKVGDVHHFRFSNGDFNKLEIVELKPNERIHWKCIDGWDEWIGTEIIVNFVRTENGNTTMFFMHKGLTPNKLCYKGCKKAWSEYISQSIKGYVETGKGKPHIPEAENVIALKKA